LEAGSLGDIAGQVRDAKGVLAQLAGATISLSGARASRRSEDQEVLARLGDIIITTYALEAALGRAVQARSESSPDADSFERLTRVYAVRANELSLAALGEAVAFLTEAAGEGPDVSELAELERDLRRAPADIIALRRAVAEDIIDREGRWFDQ